MEIINLSCHRAESCEDNSSSPCKKSSQHRHLTVWESVIEKEGCLGKDVGVFIGQYRSENVMAVM